MWQTYFNQMVHPFGTLTGFPGTFLVVFFLILFWSLAWKGLALWKAARRGDKFWFVFLLIVNTIGIVEMLYIYVFSAGQGNVETDKDLEDLKKEMDEMGVRRS